MKTKQMWKLFVQAKVKKQGRRRIVFKNMGGKTNTDYCKKSFDGLLPVIKLTAFHNKRYSTVYTHVNIKKDQV